MFCQKCGTQNADYATFCFKCGGKLIVIVQAEIKQTIEKPTFIKSNDSERIEEVKKEEIKANQEPKKKGSGWKTLFFIIIGLALLGAISNTNTVSPDVITSTVTPTVSSQVTPKVTSTPIPLAKIGDRVIVDDFTYTFNEMTTSTAIGEYVAGEFLGKKADGKFIILDVTIENIGKESERISIGSYVKIVDEQGRTFEHDSTAEIWANEEAFPFTQLQPGLPKTGKIVFDVPQNLKGKIELSGGLFSEKRYVSLSNTQDSTQTTKAVVETKNPIITPNPVTYQGAETKRPKQVTTSDIITFVTPTNVPIHDEQSQQETRISWLESIIKSTLDFIKSIF